MLGFKLSHLVKEATEVPRDVENYIGNFKLYNMDDKYDTK